MTGGGLTLAHAIGQLIVLLSMPIVGRLYAPEIYGLYTIFVSIVSIAVPMAALSLHIAIPAATSDTEARRLESSSKTAMFITIPLLTLIGLLAIGLLGANKAIESDPYIICALAISILSLSYIAINYQIFLKSNAVLALSIVIALPPVVSSFLRVIFGFINPSLVWLIASFVSASLLTGVAAHFFRAKVSSQSAQILLKQCVSTLIERRQLAIYRTLQTAVSTAATYVPLYLIALSGTGHQVGLYAMAAALINGATGLAGKIVHDTYTVRATKIFHHQELFIRDFFRSTLFLALGTLAVAGPVSFYAVEIITMISGDAWIEAAPYAMWLCVLAVGSIANKPAVIATIFSDNHKKLFWHELISIVARTTAFTITFAHTESLIAAFGVFIGLGFISYCIMVTWVSLLIWPSQVDKTHSSSN